MLPRSSSLVRYPVYIIHWSYAIPLLFLWWYRSIICVKWQVTCTYQIQILGLRITQNKHFSHTPSVALHCFFLITVPSGLRSPENGCLFSWRALAGEILDVWVGPKFKLANVGWSSKSENKHDHFVFLGKSCFCSFHFWKLQSYIYNFYA